MTPNKEDYLKTIYEIGERGSKITNKLIAELMQVSAPAVSEMVKKMLTQEWIVKDKVAGYLLTDKGLSLVTDLYRKHRLIELFLIQHLNYSTDEIHEEAEVLEHTVSDHFIDRLEILLGNPDFCPHGGSIPKKGQALIEVNKQTLAEIEQTGHYKLVRYHDNFQLIKYMEDHGLAIGLSFELLEIDPYAATFTIHYQDKSLAIPQQIAREIFVSEQ
ncbi:metal-dependent transcriptional regulator [Streptococcus loxodontisalivarius]|uniref:Manganese transport regulator n=1 Tax=Streptococcus loxodontisalivarius TaxID=1349415 RepID=A0ABS2PT59_9STRE|nr:metal-dependent transcriptional regulator [Streptococcus loxodontisalivarius]MBM7643071.1 DtxR family Mn-dependent transcriptional regulator [Streptococcus loxodontisalivarius]